MENIRLNISKVLDFIDESEISSFEKEMYLHNLAIHNKTGKGNDFLGWVDLPVTIDNSLLQRLENDADEIMNMAEVLVVIGIGGSYLGTRALCDALGNPFHGLVKQTKKGVQIIYAGHHLGEEYLGYLMDLLDQRDYAVAVISKSGTTTEPAVAFRIIRRHLEAKYGKDKARKRIFAITDKSKGALKTLADKEKYSTYVIPDDVGGRYSVLSPVGLLPVAANGIDIKALVKGAVVARQNSMPDVPFSENNAAIYAATRNVLSRKGKMIELLVSFNPALHLLIEWWKQLYGESEGKQGKGLFPAGADFTSDLHSMGQYIQEGQRILFETFISVDKTSRPMQIPHEEGDADGLNFIAGKTIQQVNAMAEQGTQLAHMDGNVPVIDISLSSINEENLGQLIYFFEKACALSGYAHGVNPFDQPGVEAYKKNMFALLGKKGFEMETQLLLKRIRK